MIPTSTDLTLAVKATPPANADAVAIFIVEDQKTIPVDLPEPLRQSATRLISAKAIEGKARQVVFDILTGSRGPKRLYLAGLGPEEKIDAEALRRSAAALLRAARKHEMNRLAVYLPEVESLDAAAVAASLVEGLMLAAFDYREYKSAAKDKKPTGPIAVTLLTQERIEPTVRRAQAVCRAQNFARTIASRPGNEINPTSLARITRAMAADAGLRCTILDVRQLKKLNMGGLLAVGAGSIHSPPCLIALEHQPRRLGQKTNPLMVVGKTITFDTGGISIKPADKMGKMIFDKCGGMAVLGLMHAVATLDLPVHVVGLLAVAENAISSLAYRPGDILRMHNGVTVEVTNTDAEGRLVLADALAWGIKTYHPAAVVDLATLTGGVIVALGKTMAGIMGNSDELIAQLQRAASAAGEKIWRLPLGEEQRDFMKSDCADIVNSAGREGHPLQGAAFLSYFVPEKPLTPWAHLDIAGVADTEKELPYYAKGATGWGVRTLLNWVDAAGSGAPRPSQRSSRTSEVSP